MSRRAMVEYRPEERGRMVTMHACWSADNGVETAVFATEAEAVDFCWRRWRMDAVIVGENGRPRLSESRVPARSVAGDPTP